MPWAKSLDSEVPGVPGDTDGETSDLYVGTLAGTVRDVMTSPTEIQTSGTPVDGKVLAWYQTSDGQDSPTVVDLVDAFTGDSVELGRCDHYVGAAVIARATNEWYWETFPGNDGVDGVWRQSLDGGPVHRVAGASQDLAGFLTTSVDGRWIAMWGHANDLVLDTSDGSIARIPSADLSDVVGFLGDRLVTYAAGRGDGGLGFPLYGTDIGDGTRTALVKGDGMFATIEASTNGTQLVHEGLSHDEKLDIWTQGQADHGTDRLIYTSDLTSFEFNGDALLMRHGAEEGGYAQIYSESTGSRYQTPIILVDLIDGTAYSVPPFE